jgi:spore coat polysaccharide biosynthesis protein SpsF
LASRTIAIVQARVDSTRLPAKVLLDLAGLPVLVRVVERLKRSTQLDKIIVATSASQKDNPIEILCSQRSYPIYRGSELDVLNRFYWAAKSEGAETVVRITADCPLVDPELLDVGMTRFASKQQSYDYLVNNGFPRGFDFEIFTFAALERAWTEDKRPAMREHVTPYIYQNPDLFRLGAIDCPIDTSGIRLTIDTLDDYLLVNTIFAAIPDNKLSWQTAVNLLRSNPSWLKINAHVAQKALPE